MIINELYHNIDGKYEKDESNYYHYTNIQFFHKIVSDFISGRGIKGDYYPANTSTYGSLSSKESSEVCLVRSDRVPDRYEHLNLSGNIGDIKFTFKENEIRNKFGKIKPIQEFPVQYKKWILKAVKECREKARANVPIVNNTLNEIEKHYHTISKEEMQKYAKRLKYFVDEDLIKELVNMHDKYLDLKNREKMESRISLPKGKFITLDLINKIYLPSYLKDDKEILMDITRLRNKGFNNISFYKCKYPKDYEAKKYKNN